MWQSHSKDDLVIEVWEKLDCENIGRSEVEAISEAVRARFGESAVDTPMTLARMLADEGAELRHSELMELHLEYFTNLKYEVEFRNIINVSGLGQARNSIRNLENLRRKFFDAKDKKGLRLITEMGRKTRETLALQNSDKAREMGEWFRLWLQSPDLFESWIKLRLSSADYKKLFAADE